MQVRVITMRYQEGLQGFPEDALRAATFGKTVLDVREHFFLHGNVPHLALVLQLGDAPAYADAGGFRPRGPDAPDPAEGLTDAQRGVYRALRAWRNETARAEGRPGGWRLRRGRFLRTRRTFAARCRQYAAGTLGDARFAQCCASSDGALRWFGFRGILDDLAPGEGSASGSNRVKRGGSWNNNSDNCTSSNRNNNDPSNRNNNNGFRLSSTLQGNEGSHPGRPAVRPGGHEHAGDGRPVTLANAAPSPSPIFSATDAGLRKHFFTTVDKEDRG